MTPAPKRPQPTQADHAARGAEHVRATTCRRCGAPVLAARSPGPAALDVKADPTPVDALGEILARLDGRLTWHLIDTGLGYQRLNWRGLVDIRADPKPGRPVIADHACPPQPVQETLL